MSKSSRQRSDQRSRARWRKRGYTKAQAFEIVKSRRRLMNRGINLDTRLRQMCVTAKIVYASDRIAKAVAKDLMMGSDRFTHHLEPYECPFCKMWHLRSTKKKRL